MPTTAATMVLCPDADTTYDSGADMYDYYGAHASSDYYGDISIQLVEYAWLDDSDDRAVIQRTIRAIGPRDTDDTDGADRRAVAEELVCVARAVRSDMDAIAAMLADAVAAYDAGDVEGVIEALDQAASLESEHGDWPSTRSLRERLICDDCGDLDGGAHGE